MLIFNRFIIFKCTVLIFKILVDATHKQKFLGVFKSKSEDTKMFENYCYTTMKRINYCYIVIVV